MPQVVVYLALAPAEQIVTCPECGEHFTPENLKAETFHCADGHAIDALTIPTSCASQTKAATDYIAAQRLGTRYAVATPDLCDPSLPFLDRPIGKQLIELLQRGDHFLIPWLDRAFTSPADFVDVIAVCRHRRSQLHLARENFEVQGPIADAFLKLLELSEQRAKAESGLADADEAAPPRRISSARYTNQCERLGFENHCGQCDERLPAAGTRCPNCNARRKKHQIEVPCVEELRHMRQLYEWKVPGFRQWDEILDLVEHEEWRDKRGNRYSRSTLDRLLAKAREMIGAGDLSIHGSIADSRIVRNAARPLRKDDAEADRSASCPTPA